MSVQQQRDYRAVNGEAWDYLATHGSDSSQPYDAAGLAQARAGFLAQPWIPLDGVRTVLCLAAGGGQQGPLFASLGYEVTVVDLSTEQLDRDRQAARALGLTVECVQADMLDLSPLAGRRFDVVHQPISACYVPSVERLYRQVAGVLRPGGWYDVEHWNPVHVQLTGLGTWDGAYTVARPQAPGTRVPWVPGDSSGVVCWHYVHRLEDLIGGLCRTGFTVHRVAERAYGDAGAPPGSHEHLAAYVPPFFRLLAKRGNL